MREMDQREPRYGVGKERAQVAGAAAVSRAAQDGGTQAFWTRRDCLQSLVAGLAASGALGVTAGCATPGEGGGPIGADRPANPGTAFGFKPVVVARDDRVHVPEGYAVTVLLPWGDPVGLERGLPAFNQDASNSADDQALQAGMHHDGMRYFPMPWQAAPGGVAAEPPIGASSEHGLLAINHEYLDHGLLFSDGTANWSAAKIRKSQRAVGISIVEVQRLGQRWTLTRPSPWAQRITAETPMRFSGPAAGHEWLKTSRSPTGRNGFGTLANAGAGWTPWGTFLSCEQNFHHAFKPRARPTAEDQRYGLGTGANLLNWGELDARFDLERSPRDGNHFGWVVEIDPYDPKLPPTKRTALGRLRHESATPAIARDGRVVIYLTDDQAFEYIYKFVSARPWQPDNRQANRELLDEGTLYVARFSSDGAGEWRELVHGRNGLTAEHGFASQAEVLIHARLAADRVGGTKMDRGQWIAIEPERGTVYCALTGNAERGQAGRPAVDAANPVAADTIGRLMRWDEAGRDPAATSFRWEPFATRGDALVNPDGLAFGPTSSSGTLWVQTDISPVNLLQGPFAAHGNNQMLAVEVATGEARRFMTAPVGAELGGACFTPDGTTLFINVQHPGEAGFQGTDPTRKRAVSSWPGTRGEARPRSATIAIRRLEGGPIGAA